MIKEMKGFFHTGQTTRVEYRLAMLRKLYEAVRDRESELLLALKEDLNKSEFEAYSTEIGIVLKEIRFMMKHLKAWASPKKVKTPVTHIGSTGYIYSEPYGVALVIAPWNFPFQLSLLPLIGAMAAGNCAVLKPSELTPRTSQVLDDLIRETFDPAYVRVVQGGVETSQALLDESFDYIFFTGSVPVGKIVMEAAAKHLTPVTLELGGKSPCIVHRDANVELAAKRIAWGKFLNAGQTCIAPDYLYVHTSIRDVFVEKLKSAVREFYGQEPLRNPNYTRIVSERHFTRLMTFIPEDPARIEFGGSGDSAKLLIEPTVLQGRWEDEAMQDEIFGPILPVLTYDDLNAAMTEIRSRPKPLALYVFTEDREIERTVLEGLSFGGGCVNDTVYHFTSPYLPFGGVGSSGLGAYHGRGSFDAFSHRKSVLKQTTRFDIPFRYPNLKHALRIVKKFLK